MERTEIQAGRVDGQQGSLSHAPNLVARCDTLREPGSVGRRLIINCDDFGMYPAVNAGVLSALEEGIASSCSLMPPCPAALEAMSLLRDRPHLPFGIHLTLFCDTPAYRWGPLTARARVPSLLDGAGEFFAPDRVPALLAQARAEEVAVEFRAQIRAVLDAGLSPTHLDWHCLADGGREDLFEVTLALAERARPGRPRLARPGPAAPAAPGPPGHRPRLPGQLPARPRDQVPPVRRTAARAARGHQRVGRAPGPGRRRSAPDRPGLAGSRHRP
nr:hypothetical protein GCM10020092_055780 [Actinoplanes digitatis]